MYDLKVIRTTRSLVFFIIENGLWIYQNKWYWYVHEIPATDLPTDLPTNWPMNSL